MAVRSGGRAVRVEGAQQGGHEGSIEELDIAVDVLCQIAVGLVRRPELVRQDMQPVRS